MKTSSIMSCLAVFCFLSCVPPAITVDPTLQAEAMPVKGRNGLQIGQVISYGNYRTSKVRRGWTKGYDYPFRVHFKGAKEKLHFTQFGPASQKAEVDCISKFKSVELRLLDDYFHIPLKVENFFAGNISFGENRPVWDFILYNPNGDFQQGKASAGYAQNSCERIEIQAVRGLKGQPQWMKDLAVYGHEFSFGNKVVAAVSTVNKGTVWIDDSLDAELKTVIAGIATGLLLRNDVEQAADL